MASRAMRRYRRAPRRHPPSLGVAVFAAGRSGSTVDDQGGPNYLIRGAATIGLQTYRQDATRVFPLENSTAVYGASNTNPFIGAIQLDGRPQLTSQLAAGFRVQADKTANYDEYRRWSVLENFF